MHPKKHTHDFYSTKIYGSRRFLPGVDAYQRHHWGSAMASADLNGVVGKSWAMNKSASARSTAVAFYPRVTWGVIYISAGKAAVYRI